MSYELKNAFISLWNSQIEEFVFALTDDCFLLYSDLIYLLAAYTVKFMN